MAVPDYQTVMLPLLKAVGDGNEYTTPQATKLVADAFDLTEDERQEMLPSGHATTIRNRVGWANTYLKNAGLLRQPKRGLSQITEEGKKVLANPPDKIDRTFLEQYPSYLEFIERSKRKGEKGIPEQPTEETDTPEELLEQSYKTLRDALADELLEQVKSCSPVFFERLVVELLVAMGYGGSIEDAGKAIGKSGDGGIDGIIKEDKLGLDVVVLQAKRWDRNSVGRPDIQAFAGSMEPYRARKGVYITTSTFANTAREYVKQIERKIVLIDGPMLAKLMIDHGIGVSEYRSFSLNKLDADYFEE